jgi:hypothetical protein
MNLLLRIKPKKMRNYSAFLCLVAGLSSCYHREKASPEQITAAIFKDATLASCGPQIEGCPWRDSSRLRNYSSRINRYLGKGGIAEGYSQAFAGVTDEGFVEVLYWTRTWSGKYRLNYFFQAVGHIHPCDDLTATRAHELATALSQKFDSSSSSISLGIFINGESGPRAIPANPKWEKSFGKLYECTNNQSDD